MMSDEPHPDGEFYRDRERGGIPEPLAAPPEPPPPSEIPSEARNLGMLCHLVSLASLTGIPGILCVLVVWLLKRDEHPFVDEQGKESLNFNITTLIASVACFLTVVGILLIIVIAVAYVVLSIVAGIKANEGISYRYPLTIRLVK